MEQSLYPGSQTFEQSLCRMYLDGQMAYDEAMTASDSPTNLAWLINQSSPNARLQQVGPDDDTGSRRGGADFESMTIDTEALERTH
jgi:twitching motility protein PilU